MKEDYYVYVYLDSRFPGKYEYDTLCFLYKPIYIGKGKGNRINKHINLVKNKSFKYTSKFYNTLNKFIISDIKIINYKLYENLTNSKANLLEINLIKELGRENLNLGPLLNLTDGGEGVSNNVPTLLQRTHKGTYKKGYKISKEILEKRRIAKLGKSLSLEHRINCSKGKNGYPILQYDLNGNFIKEWYCLNECRKNNFMHVEKAFKLKSRMSYGFLWIKKLTSEIPLTIEPYKPSKTSLNKYKSWL